MKAHFYYTSHNNLRIKVSKDLDIPYGLNKNTRENTANDSGEYPLIINDFNTFNKLVDYNGIKEEDVKPTGIDKFYSRYEKCGPLKDFFKEPAPISDITRHRLNKECLSNGWGVNPVTWDCNIITYDKGYYFDDPTKDELEIIINNTGGDLKAEAEKMLEVMDLDKEKIDEARRVMHFYEKRIQYIINDHREEILKEFDGELLDYNDGNIKPYKINTGLDLGWINIYSKNKLYNEAKDITYYSDKINYVPNGTAKWIDIRLPYSPQSTTLKKKIFKKVKEVVYDFIGEELYCTTRLD